MANVGSEQARAELGWRWPVQQAVFNDLIKGDNEWTTWTDACIVTDHVDRTLRRNGYVVKKSWRRRYNELRERVMTW